MDEYIDAFGGSFGSYDYGDERQAKIDEHVYGDFDCSC